MSGEDKSEAPTAKKKKESRKEGQVPRTPDLGTWATLLMFTMIVQLVGGRELDHVRQLIARGLRLTQHAEPERAVVYMDDALRHAMLVLVVLGSAVMVVGVACALAQGGFYLATKAVKPKFSKLNPLNGAKRIFGPQALWEGAKILLKTAVLAWISYSAVREIMPLIGGVVPMGATLGIGWERVVDLMQTIALAGLALAGADYAMQRRRIGKQTRMTKEEVKQENKQTEGDPHVKGAIRSRQMAAARNRMMSDIPKADVVLVNPTHVAVALQYDPAAGAPKVVAKGAGAVAAKIRAKAEEAEVPLVRDVPLARALYGSCKVGQEIPVELFAAVAQVLAFVIGRRTQGSRGGQHSSPRAEEAVPELSRNRRRTPV